MNREILFRGKRIDNGEWAYGDFVRSWEKMNTKPDIQIHNNMGCFNVDPATVGQFTGRCDNNSVRIFEGDVVAVTQERKKDFCRIGFENGAFMLYPLNGKILEKTLWDYWYNDWDVEVIGNIHDHPSLLQG